MVSVFDDQAAVTPAGKPVAVPIPVAPVVVCVMLVKAVLIQSVGVVLAALAVFVGVTVTAVAELVAEHPLSLVTVTVYEPEALTVIEEVVAPLLHKYEVPVLAVKTTFPPWQKVVAEPAVIVAVGSALTVTAVAELVAEQPLLLVTVTV